MGVPAGEKTSPAPAAKTGAHFDSAASPVPLAAGGAPCATVADCADLDGDGIRDDSCMWWACESGFCVGVETSSFADMGHWPVECEVDGATDGNDAFAALRCFTNLNPMSEPGFPCEDNPPHAYNVDAGGRFESCAPDGVCDLHDFYHALNAFSGVNTCTCPAGPAPQTGRSATGGLPEVRVFMSVESALDAVPTSGATNLVMAPGETRRVHAWLQDDSAPGDLLRGYQLSFPYTATALDGASGSVSYVDIDPGEGGGDSLQFDTGHPSWVFPGAGCSASGAENSSLNLVATICLDNFPLADPATVDGPQYLAEFDLEASADASGEFELAFVRAPSMPPRPFTDLFSDDPTVEFVVDEYQPLRICVGDAATCCGDLDGDGRRDDACKWYGVDSDAGMCQIVDRVTQADMACNVAASTCADGPCAPDGVCDNGDRFHVFNCFENKDFSGSVGYPCEASSLQVLNVDAGGPGTCALDGVCDISDAFHALNCFENDWTDGSLGYQCNCGGPQPAAPAPREYRSRTGLTLRAPRTVHAGELIEVQASIDGPLDALRGYQLHLAATGGTRGVLELADMSIDTLRPDYAFAGVAATWRAFNRDISQMFAGMDAPTGVPVDDGAYLATFTYRAPADAAGTFSVDVLYDGGTALPQDRTFLFGEYAGLIDVISTHSARITVLPAPGRGR
jgi:hypothetical protein